MVFIIFIIFCQTNYSIQMKYIFTLLLLYCLGALAQNTSLTGTASDKETGVLPGCEVILKQGDNAIAKVYTNIDGQYYFKDISPGAYHLEVSLSYLPEEIYEVNVLEGENILDITYPKPCDSKKLCPQGNHTNNIIPILYGLPGKKAMRMAKKGTIYLGGCTPYCEQWHCTEHNLNF